MMNNHPEALFKGRRSG